MLRSSITLAIPFYSGIDYLRAAIESVLAQRDAEWTAFVCDNASPEPGVEELVARVGGGRVRYVRNPTNLGMAGNFNRCIDLAETELVTLLHADDELAPDYARTVIESAQRHPDAAAFFCRAVIIGPDSKPRFSLADKIKDVIAPTIRHEYELVGEPGLRAMLRGNFIMAPTLAFRKRVLGTARFPEGYKFVLDQELTTELMMRGDVLVGLPAQLYRYRRHDANATETLTRTQQRFLEESAYFDRIYELATSRGWTECAKLAANKRIIKLNVGYRSLKSLAQLRFGDARRGLELLRRL